MKTDDGVSTYIHDMCISTYLTSAPTFPRSLQCMHPTCTQQTLYPPPRTSQAARRRRRKEGVCLDLVYSSRRSLSKGDEGVGVWREKRGKRQRSRTHSNTCGKAD
eukprot:scaffold75130_cov29-Phaeocystis_antarctica.AAC.2